MKKQLTILFVLFVFALSGCYSCQSYSNLWGKGPVMPGSEEKFFFDKDCQPVAKAVAPAKPAPKPRPKPRPAPASTCGPSAVSRGYPCSGSCEVIQLDKSMPDEVPLNAAFKYSIKVTNVTDVAVTDVVVTETVSSNLKVENVSPAATKEGSNIVWKLGSFEPGESKRITVSAMATSSDCIKTCAAAAYKILACANVAVVEPKLKLVKTAPSEVLLCDPIPVKFVVTNSGTGAVEGVKVVDNLPAGIQTAGGKSKLAFDVGTLAAGQSRQFTTTLKASKIGTYVNKAVATSASGLKSESQTKTIVRQPVLAITKTGPERRYIDRPVSYDITVTNKGNATAEKLVVEDMIPAGVASVVASDGGRPMAGKVVWNLGSLAPGASRKVSVKFTPKEAGVVTDTAVASATCAKGVRASAKTSIAGIPAVLLEVIDVTDPVEVGGQTTYVIVATNQGSAPGTNISIVCTLEDNERYVSSRGVTNGTISGNTVTFAPLRSLAPKAKATWRIVVKAVKAGDVRFTVVMNTDQLTRPVQETEATHLYE